MFHGKNSQNNIKFRVHDNNFPPENDLPTGSEILLFVSSLLGSSRITQTLRQSLPITLCISCVATALWKFCDSEQSSIWITLLVESRQPGIQTQKKEVAHSVNKGKKKINKLKTMHDRPQCGISSYKQNSQQTVGLSCMDDS